LFESENFFDWKYKSIAAISKKDGSEGTMWECPGFAHFGDKYVMIISPQHVPPQGYLFHNIHQAGYMVGDLDYDQGVFTHGDFYTFDYGFDFYATTMMKDYRNGRYFIIAWLAAWQSLFCEQPDGWANLLTIPRELKMREDGKVLTVPPEELKGLRKEHFGYQNVKVDKPTKLDGVKGSVGELIVEVDTKQAFTIELRVGEGEKVEKTIFSYEPNERLVTLNRDQAGAGNGGTRKFIMDPCENMQWRFYLDRSSIELFINDGEYAMSTRVYPRPESDDIVFVPAEGSTVEFKSVDYYKFE
jgi:beta-fructofuranosidase